MKNTRKLLVLMAAVAPLAAWAQPTAPEPSDNPCGDRTFVCQTILTRNPEDGTVYLYRVVHTKADENGEPTIDTTVNVSISCWDDRFTVYRYGDDGAKRPVMTTDFFQVDLGFNAFYMPGSGLGSRMFADQSLRLGRSLYVGFNIFQQAVNIRQNKWYFSYGLAVDYYNFFFQNPNVRLLREDREKPGIDYTLGENNRKSKLVAQYLTLPLKLHFETKPHDLAHSFHVSAGMRGSMLVRSFNKIKQEGGQKDKFADRYYLNAFQYGPMLEIGYGHINLFAQAQMNPTFESGRSDKELYSVAFGFIINRLDW